jgi:hypothetical protein
MCKRALFHVFLLTGGQISDPKDNGTERQLYLARDLPGLSYRPIPAYDFDVRPIGLESD